MNEINRSAAHAKRMKNHLTTAELSVTGSVLQYHGAELRREFHAPEVAYGPIDAPGVLPTGGAAVQRWGGYPQYVARP